MSKPANALNGSSTSLDWTHVPAPTLAEFEALAARAFEALPETFRKRCEGIIIRVEDFADDEVLDELDLESPFDLMGLFQGVGLPQQSVSDPPRMPNMVTLYRRAILDVWAEGEDTLGHIIAHVLVHEIGHHFGFSDADMEAIEASVDLGRAPRSGSPGSGSNED